MLIIKCGGQQGNDIHFSDRLKHCEFLQIILLKAYSVIQSRKVVGVGIWFFFLNVFHLIICLV